MAKDRNEQERRARFEKYYSQIDKDGSGHLSYEEFKSFLTTYNKKEMPEKQNEFFFHGADCDNGGSIDKEELWQLVEALHTNDKLYINKLFFRAVDKDKSKEIDAGEFVTMAELNNVEMTEEQAENQIKNLTGGNTKMTFAQMHKALTGEEIPADTDPYDGKLSSGAKTRAVGGSTTLTEEEKNEIRALISKYDKSGNGKLEYDEFLGFMSEGLKVGNPKDPGFLKQMRFLYDGMDLDASHNLDQEEVITCMENFKTGNFKYLTRMIFRGADKDKSRKVSVDELKEACQNLGNKTFSKEDFDARCKAEFNGKKKKELEYWEFYKIISGETLDKKSPDYDPYEGKYPEKSKCCLLL